MNVPNTQALVTMGDAATAHHVDPDVMRQFVMDGDLSDIKPAMRPALVLALCRHIGVDPIERPFMVFADGKKIVLYATRACTSALCRERRISRDLLSVEERTIAGQPVIIARARATLLDGGRHDESTGVVPVMQAEVEWRDGANGKRYKNVVGWRMPDPNEAANLPMKAETKAKRRAVLDLVGLGISDESEIDTIRGARRGQVDMHTGDIHLESGQRPTAEPVDALPVQPLDPVLKKGSEIGRQLDTLGRQVAAGPHNDGATVQEIIEDARGTAQVTTPWASMRESEARKIVAVLQRWLHDERVDAEDKGPNAIEDAAMRGDDGDYP